MEKIWEDTMQKDKFPRRVVVNSSSAPPHHATRVAAFELYSCDCFNYFNCIPLVSHFPRHLNVYEVIES
jgi:hypothetical protein